MEAKKNIIVGLVALIIVLSVGVIFWPRTPQNNPVENKISFPSDSDIAKARNAINTSSKITIPEIKSMAEISLAKIPADLKFLTPTSAEIQAQAGSIQFSNSKKGYYLFYVDDKELADTYLYLQNLVNNTTGWQILSGARANEAALIEAENSKYSIRINQTVLPDKKNLVYVQILEK